MIEYYIELNSRKIPIIGRTFVGRADAQIQIDDPLVSRQHGFFEIINDELFYTELTRSNPTRHNDIQLQNGIKLKLKFGDVLRFGKTEVTVLSNQMQTEKTIVRPLISTSPKQDTAQSATPKILYTTSAEPNNTSKDILSIVGFSILALLFLLIIVVFGPSSPKWPCHSSRVYFDTTIILITLFLFYKVSTIIRKKFSGIVAGIGIVTGSIVLCLFSTFILSFIFDEIAFDKNFSTCIAEKTPKYCQDIDSGLCKEIYHACDQTCQDKLTPNLAEQLKIKYPPRSSSTK